MPNVMIVQPSTNATHSMAGRKRNLRRERDWSRPLTFPRIEFETSDSSNDLNRITPVVPVVRVSGRLCFDGVQPNDLNVDVQEGSVNPAAVEEAKIKEVETRNANEPWNQNLVDAKPVKSLFRVALTHDFSQEESVSPRGLFNTRNMCFFNSVLQVLVHCTKFNALLTDIIRSTPLASGETSTTVLNALSYFLYNYAHTGDTKRAMSAEDFYNVICNHPKFHVEENRQEDAQEFLSDLLDVLETNFRQTPPTEEDKKDDILGFKRQAVANAMNADNEWKEVGQKSKLVETQHAGKQDLENPIEELFGGRFKSILTKQGSQPSITTEPFQQIPVDISSDGVNTVQQAFSEVFAEENLILDGAPTTKKLELQRLPPVLIVHLKRFTFTQHGGSFELGKFTKPIIIDEILNLNCDRKGTVKYTPIGVIYHHGYTATRGHYTADVKVQGKWYNIDDEQVKPVASSEVIGQDMSGGQGSRSAYMVFYQRITSSP